MEKYSLKWNSHYIEAFGAFELLRRQEIFVDVTLSCEGELIRVHKLILCACSDYFDRLMRESGSASYPIVFFKETRLHHLQLLIKFMYKGEVEVPCEVLPEFLKLAEQLEIKGLKRVEPESSLGELNLAQGTGSTAGSSPRSLDDSASPENFEVCTASKRRRLAETLLNHVKRDPPSLLATPSSNFSEVSNKDVARFGSPGEVEEDGEINEFSAENEANYANDFPHQNSNSVTSNTAALPDISPQDLMNFVLNEEDMLSHFDPATLTPSRFVAKLMGVLCTTEEMATHSLCGYMTGKDFKPKLDPRKVEVILRYTVLLYPYVSESLIRRSIQQKLNNVDKYMKQKKKQVEKEKMEQQQQILASAEVMMGNGSDVIQIDSV